MVTLILITLFITICAFVSHRKRQRTPTSVIGDLLFKPHEKLGVALQENARVYIKRRLSSEVICTDEYGLRSKKRGTKIYECDVAIAGCSWVLGEGVNYDDTFVAKIGRKLNVSVANLGVSSYNILQVVKRIEDYVECFNPKLIIILYASWLTTRAFSHKGHGNVIRRPIYLRSKKDGKFVSGKSFKTPIALVRCFQICSRFLWTQHRFQLLDCPIFLLEKCAYYACQTFLFVQSSIWTLSHGLQTIKQGTKEAEDARREVISDSVVQLAQIASKKKCHILISHLFEYPLCNTSNEHFMELDSHLFLEAINNLCFKKTCITYFSWHHQKVFFDLYLRNYNLEQRSYIKHFHLPDNNHPNSIGHAIIADSIVDQTKSFFVTD